MGQEVELGIKVGDKVKLVRPSPRTRQYHPSLPVGEEGTVVQIAYGYEVLVGWFSKLFWDGGGGVDWADELFYGIEWRNLITKGHDCKGNCKRGHGSYVEADEIEKI
jgi:hypothetical protein